MWQMLELSFGEFDITVINILKALWKSRQLAWTDGVFQQSNENIRKNSNWNDRNEKYGRWRMFLTGS